MHPVPARTDRRRWRTVLVGALVATLALGAGTITPRSFAAERASAPLLPEANVGIAPYRFGDGGSRPDTWIAQFTLTHSGDSIPDTFPAAAFTIEYEWEGDLRLDGEQRCRSTGPFTCVENVYGYAAGSNDWACCGIIHLVGRLGTDEFIVARIHHIFNGVTYVDRTTSGEITILTIPEDPCCR